MGTFQSIEFVGSVIGAPLGGLVAAYIGMRTPFVIVAVLAIAGFILLLASREFKETAKRAVKPSHSNREMSFNSIVELFKIGGLVVVSLGAFARSFVMQGTLATLFPLYMKSLGMEVSITGIIMGARSLGMIVGTYATSKLIDRLSVGRVLLVSFLSESVTLVLYAFVGTFEPFLLIALSDGVISGIEMNSLMTGVSVVVPTPLRGTGVGIYRTLMDTGGIIGPIVLTALLTVVGYPNIRLCFYVSSALVGAAALAMLTVRKVEVK